MCRLLIYFGNPVYLSDIISKPPHSIIKQSYTKAYTPNIIKNRMNSDLNLDGFGCAWWIPDKKSFYVYKSLKPIWNDTILKEISNSIKSPIIIAHIRAVLRKKTSPVSDLNTHPFKINDWIWLHNGCICNFNKFKSNFISHIKSKYLSKLYGSTDSEFCFGLFLSILDFNKNPLQSMILLFKNFIKNNYSGYYNFVTSNGNEIIATRVVIGLDTEALSLYYDTTNKIISSEPNYPDSSWEVIPNNSIFHFKNGTYKIINLDNLFSD